MFGSKPFGSPAGTSTFGGGSSLFGQNKTVFGQPQQQQQQTSSLFGQQKTGLFGAPQPTQSTSLFGNAGQQQQSTSSGMFGQSKPSLFGASSNSATFGATTTSLFGNTQQQPQTTSIFGGTTAAAVPNGTTIRFEPVMGQDTMQKNGTNQTINTKHMCITAMKQYEAKNPEELRVDDYMANRKAPSAGSGGSLFGASTQQQQTSTGGLFGQNTQNKSIFGNTTSAPSFAAAAPAGTSLFGAGAQQTTSTFGAKPGGLFSGSTAAAPFGASATGGGSLFSAPAVTAPTFGQPVVSTAGLFGGQPATSTATSAFTFGGAPAPAANPFGGSTFGQPATSTTTSLFGKPATAAPAFSFGGQSAPTAFGTPATSTATTSLFGAKPTTAFGTAAPSLFGAQQAAPAGGLFGTSTVAAPAFGAPAATAPSIVQAAPVELVTNISQVHLQMALMEAQLASSPYGDSPLLSIKKTVTADSEDKPNPTSTQRQMRFLAAKATSLPGGDCTPGSASPTPSLSTTPRLSALPPAAAKLMEISKGAQLTKSPLITKDLAYSPSVAAPTLGRGLRCATPAAMHNSSLHHRSLNHSTLNNSVDASIEQSLRGSSNRLATTQMAPRSALKHLDASALGAALASPSGGRTAPRDPDELPPLAAREDTYAVISPGVDGAAAARARDANLRSREPPQLNLDQTTESVLSNGMETPAATPAVVSNGRAAEVSPRRVEERERAAPAGVTLKSSDYFTIPSIELMKDMVEEGRVVLKDGLTVGRATFGSVFWPGRMELKDMILDEIVVFRHKEVTVYPDESMKPANGSGLNRPAEITLERVWPIDKNTKEDILDTQTIMKIGWREKLEKRTSQMDANFKDYRPDSGSWVFRVKHFSKYGLPEDSDEEDAAPGDVALSQQGKSVHALVQRAKMAVSPLAIASQRMEEDEEEAAMQRANTAILGLGGHGYDGSESMEGDISFGHGVPEKKIKLETVDIDEVYEETSRLLLTTDAFGSKTACSRLILQQESPLRRMESLRPAADSLCASLSGLMDEDASHGREAPVAWAAGGLFASSLLPFHNRVQIGRKLFPEDYETSHIVDMFEHHQELSQRISRHRSSSTRARHCELDGMAGMATSAPRIKPSNHYSLLLDKFFSSASQSGRASEALIWKLCQCLLVSGEGVSPALAEWQRGASVGEWLKTAVAEMPAEGGKGGRGAAAWEKVSSGQLEAAIQAAIQEDLPLLAALLAVFSVDPQNTRPDFVKQIDDWCTVGAVWTVDEPLLKIYLTLAGLTHLSVGGKSISCLDGLSWQRCLGLQLWYSEWAATLQQALQRLQSEAAAGRLQLPEGDLQLELLFLAVDRTRPAEKMLDAAVYASEWHDDVHLAWHLWSVLRAAGFPSLDPGAEQKLHSQQAEQLLDAGLPHLALFVLAHINNSQCRTLAMQELLDRCALQGREVEWEKAEEVAGVPAEWVAAAKALAARQEGDVQEECRLSLHAGQLPHAHTLFINQVAPNLVCIGDIDALTLFCDHFDSVADSIPGWGAGGLIYSEYAELKRMMQDEDEGRLAELLANINARLHLDQRSLPLQQLAMKSMARQMVEVEKELYDRMPRHAPLDDANVAELASQPSIDLSD